MSNNEIREKRKKVICDLVQDDFYVPLKEKELAMFLQVANEARTVPSIPRRCMRGCAQ